MTETKLSVIIPHYNSPEKLEILIKSIPDLDEIQVIVIDDNSNEKVDLLSLLQNKYKQRIIFLQNNTNRNSAGTCRNIGLNRAKGDWVLFADADDYFIDGWYEKISKLFITHNDIVYFPPISINLDTGETDVRHDAYKSLVFDYMTIPDRKNELRLRYRFFVPWSKLIRLDFIKQNNICFEDTLMGNDRLFSIKCGYYARNITGCAAVIYCVTRQEGSLTTISNRESFDIRHKVLIRCGAFLFQRLNATDIELLGMETYGIRILYETLISGYGINLVKEYYFLIKNAGIPVFKWSLFYPSRLYKAMIRVMKKKKQQITEKGRK